MEQGRFLRSICVVPARGSIPQKPLMMKTHHAMGVVGAVIVVPDCAAPMKTISMTMPQTILETTPLKAVMVSQKGKSQNEISQ
jgi:uncharacterized lipoprotein YajG